MVDHTVDVGGTLESKGAAAPQTPAAGDGPMDVAHLRPLSEGVLRATGLHGGVDAEGNVIDLRGKFVKRQPHPDGKPNPDGEHIGAVDIDPSTLPSDEPHARKMRLEHQTQGIVETHRNVNKSVTLRLVHGDGDVITATDASGDVEAALEALITKAGGLK